MRGATNFRPNFSFYAPFPRKQMGWAKWEYDAQPKEQRRDASSRASSWIFLRTCGGNSVFEKRSMASRISLVLTLEPNRSTHPRSESVCRCNCY